MDLVKLPVPWDFGNIGEHALDSLEKAILPFDRVPHEKLNCVDFALSVIDVLDGNERRIKLPSVKRLMDKKQTRRIFKILEHYGCFDVLTAPDHIEPGDILVVGREQAIHVMLVGWVHNTLWHTNAQLGKVCPSGVAVPVRYHEIRLVARHRGKDSW